MPHDTSIDPAADPAEWWEAFYREGRGRWSGRPNASVVDETRDLAPGTALDLACGQGGDAIWLAQRGWTVTAVDISASALAVAERNAAAAGVGGAIAWERRDLSTAMPDGAFDLVAATYLHSPVEIGREAILRAAADRVAPGGTLLIVGHAPSQAHPHAELPGPDAVVERLALPPADWELRTCALRTQLHAFAGEAPAERIDAVVRLRRRAGQATSW